MRLNEDQVDQTQTALLDGYDAESLRLMVRLELNQRLEEIAGGRTLTAIMLDLIQWAELQDRVADLIDGALSQNPGNEKLRQLVLDFPQWTFADDEKTSQRTPLDRPFVSTGGGAYVGEGVQAGGDFIGRDEIIHGDKIIINIAGDGAASPALVDRRAAELSYLQQLQRQYEYWAEKYTPLAGIAEVRQAAADGPRLDLPKLFMPTGFDKLSEHGFGQQREVTRAPVDDLMQTVEQHPRLVVLGEPGAGKTTTLWRLTYDLARKAEHDPDASLPIFVPLGGYTGSGSPLDYAAGHCGDLGNHLPEYLQKQRVVLLLDALNEMPQRDYKARVGRIQTLLNGHPDVSAVVTCRALDYVEELALEKLEIKALDVDRQREYVYRYLGEENGERLFWQLAGGNDLAELWRVWQAAEGTWAQFWTADDMPKSLYHHITVTQGDLWKTFRTAGLPELLALGQNPYMLVMLAQVYAAAKGKLPQNRGKLFAAFVDTLLSREEKKRIEKGESWPGAQTIVAGLSALAITMQDAGERGTAVDRGWAIAQLPDGGCQADDLIYLAASATLLDANDQSVRFAHQLIQEYFAALAWQTRLDDGDFTRYWPDGWLDPTGWEETAILLAGIMDDMTPLVDKLLPVNPPLAARCIGESGAPCPNATITKTRQVLDGIAFGTNAQAQARHVAGSALNYVEDTRTGVGIDAHGLPIIDWCPVPTGEFQMGDNQKTEEMPQHAVYLDSYLISKYPVTNAQYQAFVQDGGYAVRNYWSDAGWRWRSDQGITGPSRFGGDFVLPNHPVVGVSWYEATAFCRWLREKLDRPVTLPTEAQWEKAARGTDGRCYPWGSDIDVEKVNYLDTALGATNAVGIFPRGESPFGLLDMAGNVYEWTGDWYDDDYYATSPGSNPLGPESGDYRTLRGGGWDDLFDDGVRCANRNLNHPNVRYDFVGFRVVSPGAVGR